MNILGDAVVAVYVASGEGELSTPLEEKKVSLKEKVALKEESTETV